ncbi:MAG: rRNA cytosine-C5-methylase [Alistipes sp.]|nr:rRNA cytosine-C5-methylase [Alistipes sp.]
MATSLPERFVEIMRDTLGGDADNLFAALDTEPAVSLRLNPAKPTACYDGEPVGWCEWGRYLAERPQFTLDPHLHGGAYYVQEASSQFVAHLLSNHDMEGAKVLDMCAAPGGKTTIYSTLVGRKGLVVANDINHGRALALADNVQRWGMGNVVVTCNEPSHIGAFTHWFDVVAVDAPCSGEGMFRKMEEARSEWTPSSPEVCAERQREILAEAWRVLRPGGTLIYSTCTFNPTEDEGVVEWLMQEYGDELEAVDNITTESDWGIVRSEVGVFQCFHFYPHKARGEGFFAAISRKCDGVVKRSMPKARRKLFGQCAKADVKELSRWVDDASEHQFMMVGEDIYAYNSAVAEAVVTLSENLSVVYSGVAMGRIFKQKLKPEHALALYVGLNRDAVPVVDVSLEDAVEYLRRGDIAAAQFEDGINVVGYKGTPIGFVKRIGARCNNMYPKDLRIVKL